MQLFTRQESQKCHLVTIAKVKDFRTHVRQLKKKKLLFNPIISRGTRTKCLSRETNWIINNEVHTNVKVCHSSNSFTKVQHKHPFVLSRSLHRRQELPGSENGT